MKKLGIKSITQVSSGKTYDLNVHSTHNFFIGDSNILTHNCDGLSSITGSAGGKTSAQQALRNVMEEYSDTTRFILTANYPQKIIPALHSRCQQMDMTPPVDLFIKRCVSVLKSEKVKIKNTKAELVAFIKSKYPDIRKTIGELDKYTIKGELSLPTERQNSIAVEIFNMLVKKITSNKIRKYMIQNESEFGSYQEILKQLFEVVYESDMEFNKKRDVMLVLTETLYRENIAMDHEINSFSAIIMIEQILMGT